MGCGQIGGGVVCLGFYGFRVWVLRVKGLRVSGFRFKV